METLSKYRIRLKSLTPLIMHNETLCDPLHPLKKKIGQIQAIKKKTDEHLYAISRLSWEAGLYYDEEIGMYISSKTLLGCFKAAARKYRLGMKMKAVCIDCSPGTSILGFEKQTPDQLWKIKNKNDQTLYLFRESVIVNRARIMSSRPIFPEWEVKFDLYLDKEILPLEELKMIIETAGIEYGIGELRPEKVTGTYGRFELKEMKKI